MFKNHEDLAWPGSRMEAIRGKNGEISRNKIVKCSIRQTKDLGFYPAGKRELRNKEKKKCIMYLTFL